METTQLQMVEAKKSERTVSLKKVKELCKDSFEAIQEATEDYKLKLATDKRGLFDDRFVLHIEDNEGKIADVEI